MSKLEDKEAKELTDLLSSDDVTAWVCVAKRRDGRMVLVSRGLEEDRAMIKTCKEIFAYKLTRKGHH